MRDEGVQPLSYDTTPGRLSARLRVLATTDVHMQLVGHGYVADRASGHHGLAGIATLVDQARKEAAAEHRATVLLDNGDLVQGTALGSWVARQQVGIIKESLLEQPLYFVFEGRRSEGDLLHRLVRFGQGRFFLAGTEQHS